jgi:hypothetical protein
MPELPVLLPISPKLFVTAPPFVIESVPVPEYPTHKALEASNELPAPSTVTVPTLPALFPM